MFEITVLLYGYINIIYIFTCTSIFMSVGHTLDDLQYIFYEDIVLLRIHLFMFLNCIGNSFVHCGSSDAKEHTTLPLLIYSITIDPKFITSVTYFMHAFSENSFLIRIPSCCLHKIHLSMQQAASYQMAVVCTIM